MTHITADRAGDGHFAKVARPRSAWFRQCPTSAGSCCLDCAEGGAHPTCNRRCPTCVAHDIDWDQAWETSAIITELAGLDTLDKAIQAG